MAAEPPEGHRPGQLAPDFTLPDTHGAEVGLRALAGRPVGLVFFPFAFTSVCTGELADLAAGYQAVRTAGAEVVAVSTDTPYALRVFADREGFGFPLLSDFWPHGTAARSYGAFDQVRGCATRVTVLIDPEQRIVRVDRSSIASARDVAAALDALVALTRAGGERTASTDPAVDPNPDSGH